jgi:hypothetical protein
MASGMPLTLYFTLITSWPLSQEGCRYLYMSPNWRINKFASTDANLPALVIKCKSGAKSKN